VIALGMFVAALQPQSDAAVGEPPIQMVVQGVSAERTVAEFMDVCLRPGWNTAALQKAVRSSDLAYEKDPAGNHVNSFGWKSAHGVLSFNLTADFDQCTLSIGSNQPRTGRQMLAILKPAVEAELGHPVAEDDTKFYLQWTDTPSGDVERITIGEASNVPKQAFWYVFEKAAPAIRKQLDDGSYLKAHSQ